MTKDENGITIVSLVVTIIVMLIIFGVTLVAGTELINNSRLTKIETFLYLVKARAETLAEQYQFDRDVKSLISFSKLEEGNIQPKIFYNNPTRIFSYTIKDNPTPVTAYNVRATSTDESDVKFYKLIYKVYRNNYNVLGSDGMPRYLFLKWGKQECISQGVVKDNTDDTNLYNDDNASLLDDNTKFAIVVYDIETGNVASVAYSEGFKNENGVVEYTLNELLTPDYEEE